MDARNLLIELSQHLQSGEYPDSALKHLNEIIKIVNTGKIISGKGTIVVPIDKIISERIQA